MSEHLFANNDELTPNCPALGPLNRAGPILFGTNFAPGDWHDICAMPSCEGILVSREFWCQSEGILVSEHLFGREFWCQGILVSEHLFANNDELTPNCPE